VIQTWDLASGREKSRRRIRSDNHRAAFDPDGRFVISASTDGMVSVWDLAR
jgi:WD40 repeat protein